ILNSLAASAAVLRPLLSMSAATMDRLLTTVRDTAKQGRRRTMINTPLRKSIAVRTFGDWHDPAPGFFEMDMVVHCGKSTIGSYVHSLVLTDIASGWTEAIAMVVREQTLVTESVGEIHEAAVHGAWAGCGQRQRVHQRHVGQLLSGQQNRAHQMSRVQEERSSVDRTKERRRDPAHGGLRKAGGHPDDSGFEQAVYLRAALRELLPAVL